MSNVQTQIDRITQAKEDLIAKITAKGVAVPAGASIDDLASAVDAIQTGVDTSDATATAADILSGKTAYVDGEKVTGGIESKAAATYTPTTADQTIAAKQYLSGAQTIKGDANLKAENIKKGVSIFGVAGSHEGGGSTGACDLEIRYWDTPVSSRSALYVQYLAYVNGAPKMDWTYYYDTEFEEVQTDDDRVYYTLTITDLVAGSMCVLWDADDILYEGDTYTEGCSVDDLMGGDFGAANVLVAHLEVSAGGTALIAHDY